MKNVLASELSKWQLLIKAELCNKPCTEHVCNSAINSVECLEMKNCGIQILEQKPEVANWRWRPHF